MCCDGGGGCGRLDDFDVAVGADLEFLSNAENFEALADVPAIALKYMGVGHSRVLAEDDKNTELKITRYFPIAICFFFSSSSSFC